MALTIQVTKFKIRQYLLRANSPNLMLAKFSHYTVLSVGLSHHIHVLCGGSVALHDLTSEVGYSTYCTYSNGTWDPIERKKLAFRGFS